MSSRRQFASVRDVLRLLRNGTPRPQRRRPAARRLHVQSLEQRWPLAVGDLDTTFSGDGKATIAFNVSGSLVDTVHDVAQQLDGKLVLVGEAEKLNGTEGAIVRLNADGSLDSSFSGDGKTRSSGFLNVDVSYNAVGIQNDGKIVVAGRYEASGLDGDFLVVRVNTDGTLDTSFNAPHGYTVIPFDGGGDRDDRAVDLLIQPDGKIVLAGFTRTNTNDYDMAVARVNANGTRDTNFSPDGEVRISFDQNNVAGEFATSVARQTDGKLVLGGTYSSGPGTSVMAVARLTENGSLDTTFSGDGRQTISFFGVRSGAQEVAIASDGKIVLAGNTEDSAGNSDMAVARLLTDGALDSTFDVDGRTTIAFDLGGSLGDTANAMQLISGGRIIVAGRTQRVSAGDGDVAIARLRTDGRLDTSFSGDGKTVVALDLGGDKNDVADAMWIQSDGKIVVAGRARIGNNPDGFFQTDSDFAVARLIGNVPPVAVQDRYVLGSSAGANSATVGVFTNDSDGDGNVLALSRTALPAKGTLTLRSNGTFSYTPGASFHGYDASKYRISDTYSTGNEVTVEFFSHTGALVAKAYQAILNRPFDLAGLEHWVQRIDNGEGLSAFATGVFESRERLEPIIKNLYRQFLGRAQDPTQAEVDFYYDRWRNEGGPQNILPDFFASQEFYQKSGNTNRGWILELYRVFVQRTAPSESEIQFYLDRLNGGASRQSVVRGFDLSPERLGLLIDYLYLRILSRAPTATEKQTEVDALGAGKTEKQLQLQLLDSNEYRSVPSQPTAGNAVRY